MDWPFLREAQDTPLISGGIKEYISGHVSECFEILMNIFHLGNQTMVQICQLLEYTLATSWPIRCFKA